MVHVMRNPDFAYTHLHICTADQPLCFRYTDRRIFLLLKSEVSSFYPFSVALQAAAHILYLLKRVLYQYMYTFSGVGRVWSDRVWCYLLSTDARGWDHRWVYIAGYWQQYNTVVTLSVNCTAVCKVLCKKKVGGGFFLRNAVK